MRYDAERRRFLRTVGVGAVGVAVFGVAAASCSSDSSARPSSTTAASITTTTATIVTTTGAIVTDLVTSKRVDLGSVSAYVVERGDGLVVVDTGNPGSESAIEAALSEYGKTWSDVGYVIATHKHGDHVGSWNPVIAAALDADIFAGDLDIVDIASQRPITPLLDGEIVNGILAITTPGHTPGHISMLDADVGLFTGDALNGVDGSVVGPNPRYTPDLEDGHDSVKKLATFEYAAAFFGHGEPVLEGASEAVKQLAGTL
jgi:glyoxylase-like metal-dependent hydrolase (beta-lactamase superfamily II)